MLPKMQGTDAVLCKPEDSKSLMTLQAWAQTYQETRTGATAAVLTFLVQVSGLSLSLAKQAHYQCLDPIWAALCILVALPLLNVDLRCRHAQADPVSKSIILVSEAQLMSDCCRLLALPM